MFSKLFTIASLAILAVATPAPAPDATCSTGPIQCCDTVTKASDPAAANILKSIGVVVQDVNALVGLTCSAVTVVGVGSGGSCDAQAVCCENNSFGGLISIGCAPVTL
ncbi:hydrophobin [Lentinus tigrinus ALCF2SS1-7]|uniref:Hydrophobin n=1 Tax=Lentinus tigrinus ALCF2SS1-6 TaxID=1328759 RepID=A0A5C2RRC4_9APHY|nr:hydrophobin [Lentinus tigrinus ALCF2SS1-6]RPD68815.1 hydrophobin [Lentinus tigrinus ALCF2SS1-7]